MSIIDKVNSGAIIKRIQGDKVIWAIVILLSLFSLVAIYSSTGSLAYRKANGHAEIYLFKQMGLLVVGLGIIYVTHWMNYMIFRKVAVAALIVSIILLIYTLFFGTTLNEGSRWIRIPLVGFTFQTSDLAKLSLFVYLSAQLSRMQNVRGNFKEVFWKIFFPSILVCGLIALANLSTAVIIAVCCGILFFIGRIKTSYLLILGACILVLFGTLFGISKATGFGRAETWEKRIESFLSNDKSEVPYQMQHAMIAQAKGGFFGVGPGNSTQRNFLPHPYSDFIYSFIVEEYGLFGGVVIIILYLLFLWRSIIIFRSCPYAFGAFLAVALSFTLVFQAFINMGVNVGLLPVTGLTLPLLSMGGSSVLFTCLTIGIILSVSSFVDKEAKRQVS